MSKRLFLRLGLLLTWTVLAVLPGFVVGCKDDNQVKTYTVPKESPAATRPIKVLAPAMAATGPEVKLWQPPAGWQEATERKSMRIATYLVPDADGPVEVVISQFPGTVGGTLNNINRWRGQVGMPQIAEADLAQSIETFTNPGFQGYILHARGTEKHMLAVGIYEVAQDRTWFIKTVTSAPAADRIHPAFFEFARTFGRSAPVSR